MIYTRCLSLSLLLVNFIVSLPAFSGSIDVCPAVTALVQAKTFPNPGLPEQLLAVNEHLAFAKFGHNLFSLLALQEQQQNEVGMFGAGLILENTPTVNDRELLYLFVHSNKVLPVAGGGSTATESVESLVNLMDRVILPTDFVSTFENATGSFMRDFKGVVLLSCYGGRCGGRPEGLHPLATYIAAETGLPVAAPTGQVEVRGDFRADRTENVRFRVNDGEEKNWKIFRTDPEEGSAETVSSDDLRKITEFYEEWGRISMQ